MRLGILLVLLALSMSSALAQSSDKVDSLIVAYEFGPKDESALPLLRTICAEHPNSQGRLIYAREMLRIAELYDAKEFIHIANLEIGISYRIQGVLGESTKFLFNALSVANELKDLQKIGESYGELSSTYSSQGDSKKAVQYINKAIEIFREEGDSLNLCIALLNTGYDYHTMNKTDSALLYYFEADDIASLADLEETLRTRLLAFIRGNRGITQAKIGLVDQGIRSIDNSIAVLEGLQDKEAVVDFQYQLASILYDDKQIDRAMPIAKKALLDASLLNIRNTMKDASILLYRLHLAKNDYKNALRYRLTHEAIKDSIQNSNVIREMAQQQTNYEVGLMQAQVELLDVQKKNQKILNTALGSILFIVIIAAVLLYRNIRQKTILANQLEQRKNDLENLNATKDKLFSIISHDLRGPITAFSGLARVVRFFVMTKKTDELLKLADEMDDSAQQLNMMLENLLAWTIQEQGQLELKKRSISIQQLSVDLLKTYKAMLDEKRLTLHIDLNKNINVFADWNTLHTAVRNLLSNSIKFSHEGSNIYINMHAVADKGIIELRDEGIGIPGDKLDQLFSLSTEKKNTFGTKGEKGLGLGLKIVQEFIEKNDGKISVISQEGKGTTFTIELPLAKKVYHEQVA